MEYLWKFNPDTTYTPKEGDKLYDIHQKAIKRLPLTTEEKTFITKEILKKGSNNTIVRLLGWEFDFSPILHKILVQYTDNYAAVYYAINKTYLKKELLRVKTITYIDCDGKVKKPYD